VIWSGLSKYAAPCSGSLRRAILDANAHPGADIIVFNIPGSGVQTIIPTTALPTISDAVTIDGSTQPGFAAAGVGYEFGTGLGQESFLGPSRARATGSRESVIAGRDWISLCNRGPARKLELPAESEAPGYHRLTRDTPRTLRTPRARVRVDVGTRVLKTSAKKKEMPISPRA
jgi:hypothetical protein